jgi:hypothetical protein
MSWLWPPPSQMARTAPKGSALPASRRSGPTSAASDAAQTPEIAINPYFMKDIGCDPLLDLRPIALGGERYQAIIKETNVKPE